MVSFNLGGGGEEYIVHPLVKPGRIRVRDYQVSLARKALKENLLIVLPTGAGKTVIALLLAAEVLTRKPGAKILMMAPTKPLVKQHMDYFKENLALEEGELVWLTGEIPSDKRCLEWGSRRIFFTTPQVVLNDLLAGRITLDDFGLMIFDEAHRAVKNHAYAKILSIGQPVKKGLIRLGLTASPGDEERIQEVLENLHLEDVSIMTRRTREVKMYLHEIALKPIRVERDLVIDLALNLLYQEEKSLLEEVSALIPEDAKGLRVDRLSYTRINRLREKVEERFWKGELKEDEVWKLRKLTAALTKMDRLINYLETYSYKVFLHYYDEMKGKAARGSSVERMILSRDGVREAALVIREAAGKGNRHPKMEKSLQIIEEEGKRNRILFFIGLREVASEIREELERRGIEAALLIGQQRRGLDKGMDQREQVAVLERFREGIVNPLIATQVGEEGLDISECNLVIFYDHPVSAVRRIQRMGRTGRSAPGRAIFLLLKGSRDEDKYWAGRWREKRMEKIASAFKVERAGREEGGERSLLEYMPGEERVKIVVDHREAKGQVASFLKELGVEVELESLSLGDYILSSHLVVERKTAEDFASSLMDGRLFQQVKSLKEAAANPLLILEGDIGEITRRLGEKAFTGAVASLILDFQIQVLRTQSPRETALLLYSMARREQIPKEGKVAVRFGKKPLTDAEIQRYIVAGLPEVDRVLAERLLERFGTVERVFAASEEELIQVKGVGEKIARRIRKILTKIYPRRSSTET